MIVRRWSEWVMAGYTDEPDNPFGGRLIYVADRRETQSPQRDPRKCEQPFGYDGSGPTAARTTAGPDRIPLIQQGERL